MFKVGRYQPQKIQSSHLKRASKEGKVFNSSHSPDESDTLALTEGEVLGETGVLELTDGDKLGDAVDGVV